MDCSDSIRQLRMFMSWMQGTYWNETIQGKLWWAGLCWDYSIDVEYRLLHISRLRLNCFLFFLDFIYYLAQLLLPEGLALRVLSMHTELLQALGKVSISRDGCNWDLHRWKGLYFFHGVSAWIYYRMFSIMVKVPPIRNWKIHIWVHMLSSRLKL